MLAHGIDGKNFWGIGEKPMDGNSFQARQGSLTQQPRTAPAMAEKGFLSRDGQNGTLNLGILS